MFDELRNACRPGMVGGFLPGMKQIANVAALPGIVHRSIGLPDVHSGYGFAIGMFLFLKFKSVQLQRDCVVKFAFLCLFLQVIWQRLT